MFTGVPPGGDLHTAMPPFTKPQLVLALCKQLWLDNYKVRECVRLREWARECGELRESFQSSAVATLEHLGRHLDKMISANPHAPHEAKRIVAKVRECVK